MRVVAELAGGGIKGKCLRPIRSHISWAPVRQLGSQPLGRGLPQHPQRHRRRQHRTSRTPTLIRGKTPQAATLAKPLMPRGGAGPMGITRSPPRAPLPQSRASSHHTTAEPMQATVTRHLFMHQPPPPQPASGRALSGTDATYQSTPLGHYPHTSKATHASSCVTPRTGPPLPSPSHCRRSPHERPRTAAQPLTFPSYSGVSPNNRSRRNQSTETPSPLSRRPNEKRQPEAHNVEVGPLGIEPRTHGLKVRCSAN